MNNIECESEKKPKIINNPLCDCLGKLIVFAIVKENGQVMVKCENYDYGCRESGSMGFILQGELFVQGEGRK